MYHLHKSNGIPVLQSIVGILTGLSEIERLTLGVPLISTVTFKSLFLLSLNRLRSRKYFYVLGKAVNSTRTANSLSDNAQGITDVMDVK